jgi:hypothetical protein
MFPTRRLCVAAFSTRRGWRDAGAHTDNLFQNRAGSLDFGPGNVQMSHGPQKLWAEGMREHAARREPIVKRRSGTQLGRDVKDDDIRVDLGWA